MLSHLAVSNALAQRTKNILPLSALFGKGLPLQKCRDECAKCYDSGNKQRALLKDFLAQIKTFKVPANITPLGIPPYAPEMNPIE